MAEAIEKRGVTAAAVLSGNRNFPGRVHGQVDHAFLASPPLVVAYGLAGTVEIDITREPVGRDTDGAAGVPARPLAVRRRDRRRACRGDAAKDFTDAYADNSGGAVWAALDAPSRRAVPLGSGLDLPAPPALRRIAVARGRARPSSSPGR